MIVNVSAFSGAVQVARRIRVEARRAAARVRVETERIADGIGDCRSILP